MSTPEGYTWRKCRKARAVAVWHLLPRDQASASLATITVRTLTQPIRRLEATAVHAGGAAPFMSVSRAKLWIEAELAKVA